MINKKREAAAAVVAAVVGGALKTFLSLSDSLQLQFSFQRTVRCKDSKDSHTSRRERGSWMPLRA